MGSVEARLTRCFSAVFPGLSEQEMAAASPDNVESWDSVSSITLVALVEEEFGIKVDTSVMERFASFRSILEYLGSAGAQ
jgi:acyl carrier protein